MNEAGLLVLADEQSGFCSHPVPLPIGSTPLAASVCVTMPLRLDRILEAAECNSMLRHDGAEPLYGVGHRADWQQAAQIAAAEAAERYAAAVWPPGELRWASAAELGTAAHPLDSIPRCSPTELAEPDCPLTAPPAPDQPLRWVGALDLLDGRSRWLPAVMVGLGVVAEADSERFWHQTSSGCAVHVDPASAVLNAVLELIERDSIATVWLQQLALPRLDTGLLPAPLRAELDRRAQGGIETVLLDATSDLGIPVVYAVEVSPRSGLTRHVAASCALDLATATAHALNELAVSRRTVLQHENVPADPRQCRGVIDGASFLGRPEFASAFDFLISDPPLAVSRQADLTGSPDEPAQATLDRVLDRLRAHVGAVLVADLTTTELHQAGLVAVRAVIPELMPISFDHRARYLATARLYQLPAALGLPVRDEAELNPLPQPFA